MSAKAKNFRKREQDSDEEDEVARAGSASRTAAASKAAVNTFATARPKAADGAAASSLVAEVAGYKASGSAAPLRQGGDAFATSDVDTDRSLDGRAMLEKRLALQEQAVKDMEAGKKVYRGQAGYTSFIMKDAAETVSLSKVTGTHGPARAASNVRGILRVDYQPDVCKDYKETGQCPFGDSCKFLHDRSDYKSGWQMELEWQAKQKRRAERQAARLAAGGTLEGSDDEDSDEGTGEIDGRKAVGTTSTANWVGGKPVYRSRLLQQQADAEASGAAAGGSGSGGAAKKGGEEELPFACFICRGDYVSPIQTACGHYFCERCAVARHFGSGGKPADPLCAVCKAKTHGIFNAAPKLAAKLREKRARMGDASGSTASGSGASGSASGRGSGSGSSGGGGGWSTVADELVVSSSNGASGGGDGWSIAAPETAAAAANTDGSSGGGGAGAGAGGGTEGDATPPAADGWASSGDEGEGSSAQQGAHSSRIRKRQAEEQDEEGEGEGEGEGEAGQPAAKRRAKDTDAVR